MSQSYTHGKPGVNATKAALDPNQSEKKGFLMSQDANDTTNSSGGNVDGFYAPSSFPGLCVTSQEINFLVYRYLQESGFVHSAFTFAYESTIAKNAFKNADVPPGALITFLQKGLQYLGIEENLNDDGSEKKRKKRRISVKSAGRNGAASNNSDEDSNEAPQEIEKFSLLSPHACRALGRKNPPIRINVPPATAAAVVTAKIAAEAATKVMTTKNKINNSTKRSNNSSGSSTSETKQGIQQIQSKSQFIPFQSSTSLSPNTSNSSGNFNAVAAAVAMSQLHRQGSNNISSQSSTVSNGNSSYTGTYSNNHFPNRGATTSHNLNGVQATGKTSDAFISSLQSKNLSMPLTGFQTNSGKTKSKKKNPINQTTLSKKGNQHSIPKQGLGQHNSISGSFPQQQSWSAALDEAAVRIEANTKGLGNNGSQQQVQALMNAAAVSVLSGPSPSHNVTKTQGVPVNLNTNTNSLSEKKIMSNPTVVNTMNNKHHVPNLNSSITPEPTQNTDKNTSVSGQLDVASNISTNVSTSHVSQRMSSQTQSHSQQVDDHNVGDNFDDSSTRILPTEIIELSKHTSEVFMCSWNQVYPSLIATGSGDASARIWQMNGPTAKSGCGTSCLLKHGNPTDKNKDVTTLEWSPDGNQLATGSYDGVARVWTRSGELVHTLITHRGPIFSLKWNKRGNYLLSGSYDKTTIVWDVSGQNAFVKQQFDHHFAPALDVDWKDDNTFASCSTDKSVHICSIGADQPICTYTGHTDEVNAVKWDPSGTLLASCSDDCTAKVWDVSKSQNMPLYDFKSHKQEIYTVKWSPTGKGSPNPTKPLMLATASFDGTVRLWNIQNGLCIRILSRHRDSVYSVSFSPSGEYLASGSLAGQLYIWNVQDGNHVKSYKGEGDIFEVAWNKDESRVAACFSSNVVAVIDFIRQ